MRGVLLTGYGDIDRLKITEVPDPILKPHQVRVKVETSGLNFGDILIRQGFHAGSPRPPSIHGTEVCGQVLEMGSSFENKFDLKIGDRVMAYLPDYGGFAEQVVTGSEFLASIPSRATVEQGAAFPVSFMVANLLVNEVSRLKTQEKILIKSIGSSVGLALLQLSKHIGAEIYGTASESKHERLEQMGVTEMFSHREDPKTHVGLFDVVFYSIAGASFSESYNSLAPFGRLVMYGGSTFLTGAKKNLFSAAMKWLAMPRFSPLGLMATNKTVSGLGILDIDPSNLKMQRSFEEAVILWKNNVVTPNLDRVFPVEEIGQAQRYIEQRKSFGKVVLTW
ncbi:MAG: zinc-binding dehydrogenase [Bdellovibrionales bacterium]|nr:zinc-binding dehydrogenase [Bdellovibrionales bacterium]